MGTNFWKISFQNDPLIRRYWRIRSLCTAYFPRQSNLPTNLVVQPVTCRYTAGHVQPVSTADSYRQWTDCAVFYVAAPAFRFVVQAVCSWNSWYRGTANYLWHTDARRSSETTHPLTKIAQKVCLFSFVTLKEFSFLTIDANRKLDVRVEASSLTRESP